MILHVQFHFYSLLFLDLYPNLWETSLSWCFTYTLHMYAAVCDEKEFLFWQISIFSTSIRVWCFFYPIDIKVSWPLYKWFKCFFIIFYQNINKSSIWWHPAAFGLQWVFDTINWYFGQCRIEQSPNKIKSLISNFFFSFYFEYRFSILIVVEFGVSWKIQFARSSLWNGLASASFWTAAPWKQTNPSILTQNKTIIERR